VFKRYYKVADVSLPEAVPLLFASALCGFALKLAALFNAFKLLAQLEENYVPPPAQRAFPPSSALWI
jgi:hypothetical protein